MAKKQKRKKTKISRRAANSIQRKKTVKQRITVAHQPVYSLNMSFEFLSELRDLVLKSSPAERDQMIQKLNRLGRIKLAIVSGIFMNRENLDPTIADILIVGDDIEKRKLNLFLKALEAEVGKEIKYAVMEKEDFQYRMSMFDRFVWVMLESPHEKIVNKLGI